PGRPARHALADPAGAEPAPRRLGDGAYDARRSDAARAGRGERAAPALPGARLRLGDPPERAHQRGAELRCASHAPRSALLGIGRIPAPREGGRGPWLSPSMPAGASPRSRVERAPRGGWAAAWPPSS